MDTTEDLSARVLVKHILNAEPPRTPVTRSAASKISSGTRRSSRLNQNDAVAQTPQLMLRRSLKHKLRESISTKTFPNKRRTASTVLKHTPGPTSMLFDDGDTPRQILKNILLTEPVKSPVVNEQVEPQQPQPSSESSIKSRRPSIEVSGLDLPDLTIGVIETTVKRLNRKRPHRSLNVTAFEKRLQDTNDVVEEVEESDDPSSLSLSSSTSLSLKTPFNDVRTERKALQRKRPNRRKVSEEDFGAAIDKRQIGNYHGMSSLAPGEALGETTYSEGFTLGLSKLSEPDISMDIIHCNTALYAKTDVAMSNNSTLATQDKPTVMASQIQRDMTEPVNVNQKPYSFPTEENTLVENQHRSHSLLNDPDKNIAPSQSEQEKSVANHTFDINDPSEPGKVNNGGESKLEEADAQTEDNARVETSPESNDEAETQTENEEEDDDDVDAETKKEEPAAEQQSHTKDPSSLRLEEEGADSQTNDEEEDKDEEEVVEGSEDEAEEGQQEAQDDSEEAEEEEQEEGNMGAVEDGVEEGQQETQDDSEEVEGGEAEEEEQEEDNMGAVEDDVEEGQQEAQDDSDEAEEEEQEQGNIGAVEDGVEEGQQEAQDDSEEAEDDEAEDEDVEGDLQEDENEQNLGNFEHITQRAQSPEGELVLPMQSAEADLPDTNEPDDVEVEGNEDTNNKENAPQENPPDDEPMEQSVEESEEEDDEDIPLKTPAFVKEKRNFFNLDPQASPFAPKNSQPSYAGSKAPGEKPKQKAQRKPRSQKNDPGLPKSYLMNVFKHFAKTKVSADVYPVLKDVMDKFFDRLAKDLEAYAQHARRSTIEVADCELLLRRQGLVNDKVPVEVLIEKYLRMDQRKLLIPIATSGNVVFPKRR